MATAVDAETEQFVASAIVVLRSEADEVLATAVTDDSGQASLMGVGPGLYRVGIQHVGYGDYLSPVLDVGSPDRTYPLEFLLVPKPTEIEGFIVSAERADQYVKNLVGVDPRSLRSPPVGRAELDRYADRAQNVVDVVRWLNLPSVNVQTTRGGEPCFRFRARHCLPVFLDGIKFDPSFVPMLSPDALDFVVVLQPNETVAYPTGAVLLVTRGSVR